MLLKATAEIGSVSVSLCNLRVLRVSVVNNL